MWTEKGIEMRKHDSVRLQSVSGHSIRALIGVEPVLQHDFLLNDFLRRSAQCISLLTLITPHIEDHISNANGGFVPRAMILSIALKQCIGESGRIREERSQSIREDCKIDCVFDLRSEYAISLST